MLELDGVHAYYGQSHILQGVSLSVPPGTVVVLLGRNGAGKTTTLRAVMGLTPARRGRITFAGTDVTRRPAFRVARAGLGFIPAGRRVFGDLTVRQNLLLGQRPGGEWSMERVLTLFPKLGTLMDRSARVLSGGEKQMLKFGRALLGQPRMLLLDEPTEGLAPVVVQQLVQSLRMLRDAGLPMLICEQNALFALGVADHAFVIEKGTVRFDAPTAGLAERVELRELLGL